MTRSAAVGVLAVAVLGYATTACTGGHERPNPPAATSASPSPSKPDATSTGPDGATIPDHAFLTPSDTGRGPPEDLTGDEAVEGMLPPLCDATYSSDRAITVRRVVTGPFDDGPREVRTQIPAGEYVETISTYPTAQRADQFLTELRRAVARCPRQSEDERRSQVIRGPSYGDASLLVKHDATFPAPHGGSEETTSYTFVVRVGSAVCILDVHGWEMSADLEAAQRLVAAAVKRFSVWAD